MWRKELEFVSLEKPAEKWAKIIASKQRNTSANLIKESSYDMNVAAKDLQTKYLALMQEKR